MPQKRAPGLHLNELEGLWFSAVKNKAWVRGAGWVLISSLFTNTQPSNLWLSKVPVLAKFDWLLALCLIYVIADIGRLLVCRIQIIQEKNSLSLLSCMWAIHRDTNTLMKCYCTKCVACFASHAMQIASIFNLSQNISFWLLRKDGN